MKFGRTRRFASALQKLALALREHGTCAYPGCDIPWNRCDADDDPPWDQGGLTDLDTMKLMCTNGHHTHRHETGNNITRQADGTWTIGNKPDEPWSPTPPTPTPSERTVPAEPHHESIAHARNLCVERLRHVRCRRSDSPARAGP